jgi:hypothetical protein
VTNINKSYIHYEDLGLNLNKDIQRKDIARYVQGPEFESGYAHLFTFKG